MAMTMGILETDGLRLAYFKGDDSLIIAEDVTIDPVAEKLIGACGMKAKSFMNLVPEFTGFIITPLGYFPDLLRRLGRLLSKNITSKEYFQDLRLNVNQDMAVVHDPEQIQVGLRASVKHYRETGIEVTMEELETIYFYILNFLNTVGYHDLQIARKHNFVGTAIEGQTY
jgi:hypothetical protein